MAAGSPSAKNFYYASQAEIAAAAERAKNRDALKAEFQKKAYHPSRATQGWPGLTTINGHHGNHVFDPGMQRFMSMKVSIGEHYRFNPRNAWTFLSTCVLPVVIIYKYLRSEAKNNEEMYGSGRIPYSERIWRTT